MFVNIEFSTVPYYISRLASTLAIMDFESESSPFATNSEPNSPHLASRNKNSETTNPHFSSYPNAVEFSSPRSANFPSKSFRKYLSHAYLQPTIPFRVDGSLQSCLLKSVVPGELLLMLLLSYGSQYISESIFRVVPTGIQKLYKSG